MTTIKLKRYYPYLTENITLEVSDEIILDEENRSALYAAIDQLPPIQVRRVYAHYILGKSKTEIARAENVVASSICSSIRRGVKNLAEILKNFYG